MMKVENSLVKIEETIAGVDITFKVGPPAHRGHLSRHLNSLTVDEFGALSKAVGQMRSPDHWQAHWWDGYNAALVDAADRCKQVGGMITGQGILDLRKDGGAVPEGQRFIVRLPGQQVVTLTDDELAALIGWHLGRQHLHANEERYEPAADHKRRREELEKMKGGGK